MDRWWEFGKRVVQESLEDDILGQAAQLSFYFLLALFPALLCLTALIGMLPLEQVLQRLMEYLRTVLPLESLNLVKGYLEQVRKGSGTGVLSFGMLGALWAASSGVAAIMSALNVVYEVNESRSFWKARLVAIGLTIGSGFFVIFSIFAIMMGGRISQWIAKWIGVGDMFVVLWAFIQWPLVVLCMLGAVNATYHLAPNIRSSWSWSSPGAVVAVMLWLLASLGFKLYVENFNNYNAAYGSLAAVVVLMLWLYMSGLALLLGAEINSELDKRQAKASKTVTENENGHAGDS